MNRFLSAILALGLVTGTAMAASLPGPRPSSSNNWPGMTQGAGPAGAAGTLSWVTPYASNPRHAMPSSGGYPGPDLHGRGGS